jgi:hypothetical protein
VTLEAIGVKLLSTVATDVVLIVHVLGVLLSVLVGTETVDLVHALGLGELVDLGANMAHEGLLGESVLDDLSFW